MKLLQYPYYIFFLPNNRDKKADNFAKRIIATVVSTGTREFHVDNRDQKKGKRKTEWATKPKEKGLGGSRLQTNADINACNDPAGLLFA